MKLDYLREKKKFISVVLSCISILFAVLITMNIIFYFKLSARAQNIVQSIKTMDSTKPDDLNKYLSRTKEMANSLKKSNLFVRPQEKKNPITEVRCILGNEVCINNKWYKEGEKYQDAKILTIEPTQVTIEWDGKKTIYRPLDASGGSPGSGVRPPAGLGSPPPPGLIIPSPGGLSRGSIPTFPQR